MVTTTNPILKGIHIKWFTTVTETPPHQLRLCYDYEELASAMIRRYTSFPFFVVVINEHIQPKESSTESLGEMKRDKILIESV